MSIFLKKRWFTAVLAVMVLLMFSTVVTPAAKANATTSDFNISYDRFQSNEIVEFSAVNPVNYCPPNGAYSVVYAKITDSTNATVFERSVGIAYGYDGVWNTRYATNVYISSGNTGTMSLTLECRTVGVNSQVLAIHGPIPVEILPQTSQISSTDGARINKTTQIWSNEPCAPNVPVQMTIYGKVGYSNTDPNRPLQSIRVLNGTTDSTGNWSISETLDRTLYTADGNYYARVVCDLGGSNEKRFDSYRLPIKDFEYIAMGDSYSSGLGSFNYDYSIYNQYDNSSCKRSTGSYAFGIAADFSYSGPELVACAGAVTDDIIGWGGFESPQDSVLNGDTEKITLTIGGNDVGFVAAASACANFTNHVGYSCGGDTALTGPMYERLDALAGNASGPTFSPDGRLVRSLDEVLTTIAAYAPNAEIYIAGYPHLFGESTSNWTHDGDVPGAYKCTVTQGIGPVVTYALWDAQFLNLMADQLNEKIEDAVDAVQPLNVTYVSPSTFDGHGLCDNNPPYLNGVVTSGFSTVEPESLHPNLTGIQSGYKMAFEDAMN